jgi:hypothetical protein
MKELELLIENLKNHILDFNLDNNKKSFIFRNDKILLHLNKSYKHIEDTLILCFNIINIYINERFRSQGIFKQLINFIILDIKRPIYIENVSNPQLKEYLKSIGWNYLPSYEYLYYNKDEDYNLIDIKDFYYINPLYYIQIYNPLFHLCLITYYVIYIIY